MTNQARIEKAIAALAEAVSEVQEILRGLIGDAPPVRGKRADQTLETLRDYWDNIPDGVAREELAADWMERISENVLDAPKSGARDTRKQHAKVIFDRLVARGVLQRSATDAAWYVLPKRP